MVQKVTFQHKNSLHHSNTTFRVDGEERRRKKGKRERKENEREKRRGNKGEQRGRKGGRGGRKGKREEKGQNVIWIKLTTFNHIRSF